MSRNSHSHTYIVTARVVTIETVIARAPAIDIDTVIDAVVDIVIVMNVAKVIVICIIYGMFLRMSTFVCIPVCTHYVHYYHS
jgi:hypothetical protein